MKQVIIGIKDLKLSKGKFAAQAAHASVEAVLKSKKVAVENWKGDGMPKVVVVAKDAAELKRLIQKAKSLGLVATIVADAGLTEVPHGTITAGAIGPDEERKIDRVTGNLKLFS